MYSLYSYGKMLDDKVRAAAYADALAATVRPGCVVLEIGTGIGVFAVLAHRLGARRVIALETDAAIQVAREVAAANGCGDAIEFRQARSDRVTLDEKADVIISDLRGVLPLFTRHIPSIVDARNRHLAAGGALVPRRDTLWAAVVDSNGEHVESLRMWDRQFQGVRIDAGKRFAANGMHKADISPEHLLTKAARLAELDYRVIEDANLEASAAISIERDGLASGLAMWFDAELAEGVSFSNAPDQSRAIYGQMFFPLAEPTAVGAGDVAMIEVRAHLVEDEYIWRWDVEIRRDGIDAPVAKFSQSSFHAAPLTLAELRSRAADHRTTLDDEGRIDAEILRLMDGSRTNGQVAETLLQTFPRHFATVAEALTRVGRVASRYSQM